MSTNSTGATSTPAQTLSSTSTLTMSSVPATTPSTTAATTSSVSVTSSIDSSISSAITSDSTTTVPPTTTIDTTSIVSASSAAPTTQLITSIVTQTPSEPGQTSVPPVTVIVTSQITPTATSASSTSSAASSSTSSPATLQPNGGSSSGSGGLPPASRTAIAVVVPIVAVALIVLAALFFWRKRKQRKNAEEARRKEVEEYGYNPNNDPTLPAVTADGHSEMAEDHGSGYRGWGAAMSNRKPSTTLSGGHTHGQLSDAGSNPGGFSQSPTAFGGSDGQNSDMYHKQRDTMTSDDLAALGAAPAAGSNTNNMRRGPSNASSSYSAGHRSDTSDPPSMHHRSPSEGPISPQNYAAYNTAGPYGDGTYGGADPMPVVRDVSARRNTRIEQGGAYQQGNSGISQNF
ncbi:hypothetical protein CAC42_7016 [Sphaceloma murrayae]|uniref:Uncharacterized protein n=1 Tax=Sphaceloma murrayae TaxID=2082308 RepID=A0A2K1QR29_9PEZI|nr:hypothetical protein CAC42_7016 [Sphaceloma murrayae]